jgi:glycogen debranching enzyme
VIDYRIREGRLPAGSTLGSPKAVAVMKATGALAKLYSCEAGADAFGSVLVRHWDRRSGIELRPRTGHILIAPERQEHFAEYPKRLSSRERAFLLNSQPRGAAHRDVDPPAAYLDVSLHNGGNETSEVRTEASVRLAGRAGERISARFDDALGAFVVHCEGEPFVRIAAAAPPAAGYEVTDDRVAVFRFEHALEPGESASLTIVLTFSLDGEGSAYKNLMALPSCGDALARTQAHYRSVLDRAVVMTPEAEVNRGVAWAKVNMLRCLLQTQQGWCLVNDPAQTTHGVARDTAWFALGAGYVAPWFAAESLRWFFDHLTEAGMAVEWYDTRTGAPETYGLDVNDNTPLLLWAAWHHFCVSGDLGFLRSVYPNALRAARHIVSKRGAQGLVWCHAPGTGARGIVGWRNALEGERLAGATTELNCECYGALRAIASIAAQLGDRDSAETFARYAEELRAAIDAHLLDASRNLYYLAIDEDGRPRSEVTSDLVFPLLFGVAEPKVAARIIETLSSPEFWSDAGLHTLPRNAVDYGPADGSGLLGGIWAGPTFWFATAVAPSNSELMVDALTATFRHYAEDPLRYNTVPGQFAEWLHGETLTNCGMMLSPWLAPKYLWAAVEAAAALDVTARLPKLHHRLPPAWQWLAARNVMVRGCDASWFAVRMERVSIYLASSQHIAGADRHYEEDITAEVTLYGDDAVCVALRRSGEVVIFIGNSAERSITTSVAVVSSRLPQCASVRVYDSVTGRWSRRSIAERGTGGWTVRAGRKGFCILEFGEESQ